MPIGDKINNCNDCHKETRLRIRAVNWLCCLNVEVKNINKTFEKAFVQDFSEAGNSIRVNIKRRRAKSCNLGRNISSAYFWTDEKWSITRALNKIEWRNKKNFLEKKIQYQRLEEKKRDERLKNTYGDQMKSDKRRTKLETRRWDHWAERSKHRCRQTEWEFSYTLGIDNSEGMANKREERR